MNNQIFGELLQRCELRTVDFKLEHYDFAADTPEERARKRGNFVKDIVCMANTPRTEPAYIVIGVMRRPNGETVLRGVAQHVDDNLLQQQLDGQVYPHPRFHYEQVEHEGKQFGVIEIAADLSIGPFYPTRDVVSAGIRRNVLYWRRGTQNAEAGPDEQRAIHRWFRGEGIGESPIRTTDDDWSRFLSVADVSELGRNYVLVLAPGSVSDQQLFRNMAWVDWSMVVDFDPASETNGVLKHCRESLEARRTVHRVTLGDDLAGNLSRGTFWYFCRGIAGRDKTVFAGAYPAWNKAYGADSRKKFQKFAASCSAPVVLIALWSDPAVESFIRNLMESAASMLADRLSLVIVTENEEQCRRVAEETGAVVVQIATRHFLEGLGTLQKVRTFGDDGILRVPGSGGVPKELVPTDVAWLEEDLELVHLAAGQRLPDVAEPVNNFLRGAEITWFELGLQADVEREKTEKVLKIVRRDLERGGIFRVNLLHRPGAGGSTVARRVLWSLHREFPTAVLRRCVAKETIERLARIYAVSEKPILILREGSAVSDNDADELAELLGARHIPSVLLQVLRRYSEETEAERRFFLDAKLTPVEAERFRVILSKESPARAQELQHLAGVQGFERNPFIFGLTAFSQNFTALRPFVQSHLHNIPAPQTKVLLFLALAHAFGQQAISDQHFADLLQVPHSRRVQLRSALNSQALGLLVEVEKGRWRTMHDLVAREILKLLLGEGLSDDRNWNTRLADLACEFVDFCRTTQPVHPEELQAVVERVFYYRNDAELLGSVRAGENLFSELINEIPNLDGRLRVFKHIVDLFPDSPHYWAHLGRYYSIRLRDFEKAIQALDRALALNPKDNVLHHMKGMALRNLAYKNIEVGRPMLDILSVAKQASECFAAARSLAPDEDFGYISEAQMITRLLDYAKGSSTQGAVTAVANPDADPWIREAFQKIEDLLLAVRQRRVGEQASEYEERCRAELDLLYGAHDQALQRWQNLLDRRDGRGQPLVKAAPIRRSIVWTHLARCGRKWEKMPGGNLQRALDLLEQNIQEEPGDDRNIRLWIQGARFLQQPPSIEVAAERVAYWRSNGDSLDATYYLYVLQALQALGGSTLAAELASRALEECRNRVRFRRGRTRSFEWLAQGQGLRQLVHQDQLGEWDRETEFWKNTALLRRLEGIVASISGPQAGEIELSGALRAFFVPAVAKLPRGRAENVRISFFLGFSYEGLRAWSVLTA